MLFANLEGNSLVWLDVFHFSEASKTICFLVRLNHSQSILRPDSLSNDKIFLL